MGRISEVLCSVKRLKKTGEDRRRDKSSCGSFLLSRIHLYWSDDDRDRGKFRIPARAMLPKSSGCRGWACRVFHLHHKPGRQKPIDLLARRIRTQMKQVDKEQGLMRSNQVIRRPEHEVKKPWTRRNLHDGTLLLAPYYHRSANVASFATPLSCREAKRGIVQ